MKNQNFISYYRCFAVVILLFIYNFSQSQEVDSLADLVIIDGDTLPQINLNPVTIISPYEFKSRKQKRQYTRLTRYVKKVYPYAKLAKETLQELYVKVDSIDDKTIAKRYIKQVDKRLREEYGDELKHLTIMQGRILIKLIDRETGNTSYELLKELRGSFSAFMWQSLARLFGENLKSEYDPVEDDKMIEHIVLMIENGQI